jgi:hypothetical protein
MKTRQLVGLPAVECAVKLFRRTLLWACTILLTMVIALFSAATVASAQQPNKTGGQLVAPSEKIDGLTGVEVQAEAWFREYTYPIAGNPGWGNGENCITLGRQGKLLLAFGGETCTVRQGTALWVVGISTACSNVEDPPFFGADEAAQRECAFAYFQGEGKVDAIRVTVDGGRATNIHNRHYEFYTAQRRGQLPRDNTLGVPPQKVTLTAYGWGAWLTDLPPGHHTLRSEAVWADGSEPHVWDQEVNIVH